MNSPKRGRGRPHVSDARNRSKSFRLSESTDIMLKELMAYYGKKEGKAPLSVGCTIECLIKEKYFEILSSDYE